MSYARSLQNIIQDRINHLEMVISEDENSSMPCSDCDEEIAEEIEILEKCADLLATIED